MMMSEDVAPCQARLICSFFLRPATKDKKIGRAARGSRITKRVTKAWIPKVSAETEARLFMEGFSHAESSIFRCWNRLFENKAAIFSINELLRQITYLFALILMASATALVTLFLRSKIFSVMLQTEMFRYSHSSRGVTSFS